MPANDTQHGGNHYKAEYEHWDLVADLQLNYYIANATKYITRHRKKNGREDVQKAGHYLDKNIELIEHGRMPAPFVYVPRILSTREEILNCFLEANGVSGPLEVSFFVHTVNAIETEDLRHARKLVDYILAEYPPAIVGNVVEDHAGVGIGIYNGGGAPLIPNQAAHTPAHIAAAMDSRFLIEGYWGDGRVQWRCKTCRKHFYAMDGIMPSSVHQCEPTNGSAPTRGYIDQDR